ncbi:hypothetical protein [Neomegalonema sp.]|uniref:hypothetical protein n=1 Tax=Neomegalonema sp. TaxID=2039713 RepID=UPI0026266B08|nr:hypothetical protein [Neomegalonema sp.]MDD2868028.1 hypothetical protein [Neomegalonema sp.]
MNQVLKSALCAFGLAAAALTSPALAQPWGGPGPGFPGGGFPGPGGAQPRIIVPPGGGGCQSAAQRSHVVFQWNEAQQLCQQNPWSDRPVRCVEDLQRYGIPVWQSVNVCRMAR